MDLLIFLGALLLFYYPSRVIRGDSSFLGKYHITEFIRKIRQGGLVFYLYSFFFSIIQQSSYRTNLSFKVYYINGLIPLQRTSEFLWFRELGKPLFIFLFLLIDHFDKGFLIAFFVIVGFILHRTGFHYYNRFLYSFITIALGISLLERAGELSYILEKIAFLKEYGRIINHFLFWVIVGAVTGFLLKDSLIFLSIIFYLLTKSDLLLGLATPLLLGFVWMEALVSFKEGNYLQKKIKIFLAYGTYVALFSIFMVLGFLHDRQGIFLSYFFSVVFSVAICFLLSTPLIVGIKKAVSWYYGDKATPKDITLADRRIIKAAEMNFMLARRVLRKNGDFCFKMLFGFLKYSFKKGEEFDACLESNNQYVEGIHAGRDEIERILERTSELNLSKKTYLEMQAIHEVSKYYVLMSHSIVKMTLKFKELDKLEYFSESEEKIFIIDFVNKVIDFLKYTNDYIQGRINNFDLEIAHEMEEEIDNDKSKMSQYVANLYKSDNPLASISFFDIIKYIEHIGDFSLGISRQLNFFYYEG